MKLRIRFGKHGAVKFIGHLDMMRFFQKAFRRAGFDLKYSQGYHPHPTLSFASPLGVGLESTGEYLDVEVLSITDLDEMTRDLNAQMAEGITVYSIVLLPDDAKNSMSLVAAADYMVAFREGMMPCTPEEMKVKAEHFMQQKEIVVLKKTKKSEREVDIRPLIFSLKTDEQGVFHMQLSAGSAANLKPELVMDTFYRSEGLDGDPYAWLITRCEMYGDKGSNGNRRLVPLESFDKA